MEDHRARRKVWVVDGALEAGTDGVEGAVTASQSSTTSLTHRQMLVNLEHLRVESHVLHSRRRVVDQCFHLQTNTQFFTFLGVEWRIEYAISAMSVY